MTVTRLRQTALLSWPTFLKQPRLPQQAQPFGQCAKASSVFERFTERACQVVVLAQEEARTADRDRIDSVAVLLGLFREEEGLAARILGGLSLNANAVREAWSVEPVEPLLRGIEPSRDRTKQVPFTIQAKCILELALREALSLGHNYIGTEHILLGLIRRHEARAALLLHEMGADSERIRGEVMRALSGPRSRLSQQVAEVGITLHRGHANALLEFVGKRPHDEQWSKAVYEALLKAVKAAA